MPSHAVKTTIPISATGNHGSRTNHLPLGLFTEMKNRPAFRLPAARESRDLTAHGVRQSFWLDLFTDVLDRELGGKLGKQLKQRPVRVTGQVAPDRRCRVCLHLQQFLHGIGLELIR
jgi:hypothetical protein